MRNKTQGLTLATHAAIRSRPRNRKAGERRQVGDVEIMLKDEPGTEAPRDEHGGIDDAFYTCTGETLTSSGGPERTV